LRPSGRDLVLDPGTGDLAMECSEWADRYSDVPGEAFTWSLGPPMPPDLDVLDE
jgi:hypothetical protein